MRKSENDEVRMIGEGNWLGKSPHNFLLTQTAWDMLHEIAKILGINHSSALELIIRIAYYFIKGRWSEIVKYLDGRNAK